MKRRIVIALTLALLLGLGASAGLADSSARPFKGRVPGADLFITGECSVSPHLPTGVPCLEAVVVGKIIATHLGEGRYIAECGIDYAHGWWDPEVPTAICGLLVPGSTFTFVAANGDKLYGSITGPSCHNLATGYDWGTFQGQFTGGTGRFADARGTVEKVWTGQNGVVQSSWEGWIEY